MKESYAIITELTPEIYKEYNKYKISLELCKELSQKKLCQLASIGKDEDVFMKKDRFMEVLSMYLQHNVDGIGELIDVSKKVNYKPSQEIMNFIKAIEVKNPNPVIYRLYSISEDELELEDIKNEIQDKILENFGKDHLASFVKVSKLRYFPFEHKKVKTIKLSLQPILNKMMKENNITENDKGELK